jgi:hypothetical protein
MKEKQVVQLSSFFFLLMIMELEKERERRVCESNVQLLAIGEGGRKTKPKHNMA